MTDQLYCLHTFFKVPVEAGGGEYLVGITRAEGGFSGYITLNEQGRQPSKRKLLAAWINYDTNPVGDRKLIQMVIAQALAQNLFLAAPPGGDVLTFHLDMATTPYEGEDLKFFE